MTSRGAKSLMSGPLPWTAAFAFILGGISFCAGFLGPMFLSTSNLGPLLGVIVTGPVGTLVGALVGCGIWATREAGSRVGSVWKWIAGIWVLTLLYTLFMVRFGSWGMLFGVTVQLAILAAVAFLLYHRGVRGLHSRVVKACGPVVLAVVGLIVLISLFPPVTRPWWGPASAQPEFESSTSLPRVAFLLDPGFDASRHIPRFAVNVPILVLGWAFTSAAGLLISALIARGMRSGAAPRASGTA